MKHQGTGRSPAAYCEAPSWSYAGGQACGPVAEVSMAGGAGGSRLALFASTARRSQYLGCGSCSPRRRREQLEFDRPVARSISGSGTRASLGRTSFRNPARSHLVLTFPGRRPLTKAMAFCLLSSYRSSRRQLSRTHLPMLRRLRRVTATVRSLCMARRRLRSCCHRELNTKAASCSIGWRRRRRPARLSYTCYTRGTVKILTLARIRFCRR